MSNLNFLMLFLFYCKKANIDDGDSPVLCWENEFKETTSKQSIPNTLVFQSSNSDKGISLHIWKEIIDNPWS